MWFMELENKVYYEGKECVSNRVIEMFHSRTDINSTERILTEFKKESSTNSLICTTVAFDIGIDIPDTEIVINWGAPSSVPTYWQEVGKCGRDGRTGLSITYPYARSLLGFDEELNTILKGYICYRRQILSLFVVKGMNHTTLKANPCANNDCDMCCCEQCLCCSICFQKCVCSGRVKSKF